MSAHWLWRRGLELTVVLLTGCFTAASPPEDIVRATHRTGEDREAYAAVLSELSAEWFALGTVPDLCVKPGSQTWTAEGLVVTVTPERAEGASWNGWPDGSARLFNDSLGFLIRVHIQGKGQVRWDPSHTSLAVNDSDQVFVPVPGPDDLLGHLLRGARMETRAGLPPNLSLRLRNADEFRRNYLSSESAPVVDGVMLFPAPARTLQVLAMELRLGVVVEGDRLHELRFLFE